jgi:predicted ATPase
MLTVPEKSRGKVQVMDQWEFEKLKNIEDIFKADDRSSMSISNASEALTSEALIRHHGMISSVTLSADVDDDVRVQFEIARNIFLYSFFYYRFGMTSLKQAAASTELGLRLYIGKSHDERENTLKKLLRRAHSQGLVNLKEIKAHLDPEEFIQILTSFRNTLAHGSPTLFAPANCVCFIQDYAAILNMFYARVRERDLKPTLHGWE